MDSYGVTRHRPQRNLNATLAWSWHHPAGRHGTVLNGGIVIDDELNLYTAAVNGLHKLSPDGRLLWTRQGEFSAAPVLAGDALFGDSKDGRVFALDIDSGLLKWERKVAVKIASDCHSVGVSEGVVVTNAGNDGPEQGGHILLGLNASNGDILWTFKPDSQLWNIMPMFTGNGTFLFQDQVGGAYHLDLFTGKTIWRSGVRAGWAGFWTDGMSWLGPNGLFYVAHVDGQISALAPTTPSDLRAYRVSDGAFVWRRDFPYPINSQPVVAQLREGESPSLVMNSGLQGIFPMAFVRDTKFRDSLNINCQLALLLSCLCCLWRRCARPGWKAATCCCVMPVLLAVVAANVEGCLRDASFPSEVQVLDAATGELRWRYEFPVWKDLAVRGDEELFWPRVQLGVQPFCLPNGWGSPSVDGSGTIWLGHQNGLIYSFRDDDGDRRISDSEVSSFDMGASSTHFGGAYAPGMLAWASCDTVFVFKS